MQDAGYIATSTTYTCVMVELRKDHCLLIRISGQNDVRQLLAYEFFQLGYTSLLPIVLHRYKNPTFANVRIKNCIIFCSFVATARICYVQKQ